MELRNAAKFYEMKYERKGMQEELVISLIGAYDIEVTQRVNEAELSTEKC